MIAALGAALDVVPMKRRVLELHVCIALRLVGKVRGLRVSRLAAGKKRFRADPGPKLDNRHEAVSAPSVQAIDIRPARRYERSKRAPVSRRHRNGETGRRERKGTCVD